MAYLNENRLFNVRTGKNGNIIYSQIEAKTAEEAIAKSNKRLEDPVVSVESAPIYSASIGLECDIEDKREDAVFDIHINGTDKDTVDKLRDAIALAIGGMGVEFAGLSPDGSNDNGRALRQIADGIMVETL